MLPAGWILIFKLILVKLGTDSWTTSLFCGWDYAIYYVLKIYSHTKILTHKYICLNKFLNI